MTDAFANLAEKIGDPAAALEKQRRSLRDVDFIWSHEEDWRKQHPNRWVGVYDQKVIAREDTLERLLAAVKKSRIPLSDVTIQFIPEERVVYQL
jgi:hypothetical protein